MTKGTSAVTNVPGHPLIFKSGVGVGAADMGATVGGDVGVAAVVGMRMAAAAGLGLRTRAAVGLGGGGAVAPLVASP
jgi:hypothetical protein